MDFEKTIRLLAKHDFGTYLLGGQFCRFLTLRLCPVLLNASLLRKSRIGAGLVTWMVTVDIGVNSLNRFGSSLKAENCEKKQVDLFPPSGSGTVASSYL